MEQENVITSYSGNLYGRLFAYMKPYLGRFILALLIALAAVGMELARPLLLSTAIDNYIQGYAKPYAVVSADEADMQWNGMYLTKDFDFEKDAYESYAEMLYQDDTYWFFTDLDRDDSAALQKASESSLAVTDTTDTEITIEADGKSYTGTKLVKEDLTELRKTDYTGIIHVAILLSVIILLNTVFNISQTWLLLTTGQTIIYNVRNEVVEHIHSLPLRFFDTHPVGQLVTRATSDVEKLNQMYSNALVNLLRSLILIVGYLITMFVLNVKLAFFSLLMMPVVFFLTVLFTKTSRSIYRVIRTRVSSLNTFLSEHISGMKIIQIFAREDEKYAEFQGKTKELYQANMKELMVFAIFRPLLNIVSNLALAMILYQGAHEVIGETLTVGVLYVFTSYVRSMFDPLQELSEQFSTIQNAFASAEKIFTLLDEKNPILEPETPVRPEKIRGKIEFRNVWFAYDGEDFVLRDVSFVINPGQKVAFVGATGAGKSSILNLIGRYYEIQKGQILIDDVDIRELSTEQIRQAIGQVQQDVFIFTGTIKDNIRLGYSSITDEQIEKAAQAVNADHFINQLPKKYDEAVTERGSTLSAGQRQLLSFARTLAIDPTILVMDEATANIDTETEQLIQDALKTLMEGRTTIMVAHRLSTIQQADNIIVLHKGKIRESGTHQELLAHDGIYKKLYELQLYGNDD